MNKQEEEKLEKAIRKMSGKLACNKTHQCGNCYHAREHERIPQCRKDCGGARCV
jgi:hypothetical protein